MPRSTIIPSVLILGVALLPLPVVQTAVAGLITAETFPADNGDESSRTRNRAAKASRSSHSTPQTTAAAVSSGQQLKKVHQDSTKADNAKRKRKSNPANAGITEAGGNSRESGTPGPNIADLLNDLPPDDGSGLSGGAVGFDPLGLSSGAGPSNAAVGIGAGLEPDIGAGGAGTDILLADIRPLWPDYQSGLTPSAGFSAPAAGTDGDVGPRVLQNPEPASLFLFGIGAGVIVLASCRRSASRREARSQ